MERYIEGLRPSAPVAMRQGYAAALAALPACLLRPQALQVLDALGDAAQVGARFLSSSRQHAASVSLVMSLASARLHCFPTRNMRKEWNKKHLHGQTC